MTVNTMWVPPGVPPSAPKAKPAPPPATPAPERAASVTPTITFARPASRAGSERTRAASVAPFSSYSPYATPTPAPFTRAGTAAPSPFPSHSNGLPSNPTWAAPTQPLRSLNDYVPMPPRFPDHLKHSRPSGEPSSTSSSSQSAFPAGPSTDHPSSDPESAVDARLLKFSPQTTEEGSGKRKRSLSPPFVFQPEPHEEEPAGYFSLSAARVVDRESPKGESPTFLPLPLPSKRAKTREGARAVLVPAELLPVFPLPPLPSINDEELLKQVSQL